MQLKRNLLSVALASATMLIAASAQAQETGQPGTPGEDATTLDSVVVTGIRAGIESSISTKRDSTSIVEAISAEDNGKLPDISIAESIARLPGLAAQRVAGRAQVISVRGLSPDFATTLLNGREVVSTGDNRSVEFDQYPSELFNGVTVYKTPDASLVGQGLSATIDMQTVRPLSYSEPVAVFGARYQKNSLGSAADSDGDGNRINFSYIGQFLDNTLGISFGYSHLETPIQEEQVGLYEPWSAVGAGARPGVPAGTYYSDGIKALRRTGYAERDGMMATVQYRPSNAWTSTLDLFHTQAEQVDTANQFEVHIGGYNGNYTPGLSIANAQVNGNNTFVGGSASGVYPLVRGMYNKREDEINAFGWNNDFAVGSARVNADLSYSKASRDELNLENNTQRLPAPQLDTVNLGFSNSNFSQLAPGLDYSNPGDLFLTNTIYGSGYGKVPSVDDELKSARVVVSLPSPDSMGWLSNIDVGLNYADRQKQKTQPEGNINLGAQGDTTIASNLQFDPVNLGFAGVGYIPAWNVPAAVARYMTFNPVSNLSYLIPKAWTVDEEITTGYVQADIDTEWGSVGVRGNVGIQVQHTDQSSNANYWDGTANGGAGAPKPFEDGASYTDWLPSMNLAFSFAHDQTLRVALARQVARARVDDMRASLEFGVDTSTGKPGASGGNPRLDPWRANAFDISYEKYFGTKAYVAAAYFYKDLRSYIYKQTQDNYDFSAFVADYVPPAGGVPAQTTGNFTAPYNGQGGMLQGLELSASLPLDMLWEPLEGFGILANASFNDSDIEIVDPDSASSVGADPITLPGLSDEVYSFTAYFQRAGFEARVSQRWRSDFIGEIGNFNGNRTLRYVVGDDQLDAQISYEFGEGTMAGLSLYLQGSNLTNSAYQTYASSKDRPLEYIEWGRTYLVGASYKF
ncbi:MAG TPA: TonB-dependent receptor [Lysobacter sp.]